MDAPKSHLSATLPVLVGARHVVPCDSRDGRDLAGKSPDEVFAEAASRFAAIHAKARAEQELPLLP